MRPAALDTLDAAPGWHATARAASPYAGFVSRTIALTVDVALLTVAALAISVLPGLAWDEVIGTSPGWLGTTSGMLAAVLPFLYFTGCWWWAGQTAGGVLIGTAVRRTDGRRLSLVRSALRAAVGLALAPLWLFGLLGILWDPRRRAWHDLVFRTVVRHVGSRRI